MRRHVLLEEKNRDFHQKSLPPCADEHGVTNATLISLMQFARYIEHEYRKLNPPEDLGPADFETWARTQVVVSLDDFESGRVKLPPQIQESGAALGEVIEKANDKKLREYLDFAWNVLTEGERADFCAKFNARVLKAITGGGGPLEARTKEIVLLHVAKIADEVVSQKMDDLRAQVTKEVDRRWQETVEVVVTKRLAEALGKIKAEMAK